ncbi:cadherin-related family member 5 isoform X1 [Garra rufa]|uniref:cadherin-related family member 5 isoform X1 n=1 Tax=Garra rufa TaxID=137080 RepID=UPI003CCE8380
MGFRSKGYAAVFVLLGVFALSNYSEAQNLCSTVSGVPIFVMSENNTIGDVVTTLNAQDGVTATITRQNPAGLFSLSGYSLIADTVLDFETFVKTHEVDIECTKPGSLTTTLNLNIAVTDINDNAPVFAQSQYTLNVDELIKEGTSVDVITATDPDKEDVLYYTLDPPEGEFILETNFKPNFLVNKHLDYDQIKKVTMTLYAQDTPIGSTGVVSHTASTTVVVNINDIDNRPPWFQPCTEHNVGTSKVCVNTGYDGTVNLNQIAPGPLPLKPGPLFAIDGDNGINKPIGYAFLTGNEDGTFQINNDGSITMIKPVTVSGPVVLTVMAYQTDDADQFATTTVILRVVVSSLFPPTFVESSYEGFISEDAGVDSMVLESKTSNRPLRVKATDKDFADGYNPSLRFEVVDSTDFTITPEGFILMAKAVSPGTLNLEMRVVDTTNDESSTATLAVEITPGVPTTTPGTTIMTSTIKTTETTDSTTNTKLTDITTATATVTATATATASATSTTSPPDTVTTMPPSTGGSQVNTGEFSSTDMAALGASLAVVIVLCLVCIGLMIHRIKGHNSDWKKISEVGVFRSKIDGGSKEGVQYSNEAFQHDGDSGSVNNLATDLENKLESGLKPLEKATTSAILPTTSSTPPDSTSLASSENSDGEKEVKPILTKERRNEEGYKAVWFKQDIDPNKEEVVIIPDAGEADGDHEEDDDTEDEDNLRTDMDSDDEEGMTSDL